MALFAGLLAATAGRAAQLHFRNLGIVDGLAQSTGAAIVQGPNGLLWLGTQAGLQRYDGYEFVHYHHVLGDPTSLSQDDVRAIARGADGSVWVATGNGGLNRLKPDRSGFQRFTHEPGNSSSLADDRLNAVLLDTRGQLWVAGHGGIDRYLAEGGFQHYFAATRVAGGLTGIALLEDRGGRIWVGTSAGLWYVDAANGNLRRFIPLGAEHAQARRVLGSAAVTRLLESHDGRLWVGTGSGLVVLDAGRRIEAWLHHDADDATSLGDDRVRALAEDVNGTVWVGTWGGGLDRLDPSMRGWAARHIRHRPGQTVGLSDNQIMTLFTDATDLLWVGTYGSGFDIYNTRSTAFAAMRHDATDPDSLASDIVWAIHEDHAGTTWVGTDAGLTRFGTDPHDVRQITFNDDPAVPGNDPVYNVLEDADQRLWVGTRAALYHNNGPGTALRKVDLTLPDGAGSAPAFIDKLLVDADGQLWATGSAGLLRLDPAGGGVLEQYPVAGTGAGGKTAVGTVCQTEDGVLWLGTRRGLRRFDPRSLQALPPPPAAARYPAVFGSSDVLSCLATPGNDLWVGTSDGLVHYRQTAGTVHVYDTRDGLPSTTIYSLAQDARGSIWAGTGRGLVRVDPHGGRVRVYGLASGLSNLEFNQMAAFASGGILYFGGIHGVTLVYPQHLSQQDSAARVAITGYTLMGRGSRQTHLTLPDGPVRLAYWQSTLTVNLAVLDYAAPGNNSFLYRLDGFDHNWRRLQGNHAVTYTNLDPGRYTLRVRGIDSSGETTGNVATLTVDVQPPPWATPWAWTLYALLVLLLVLTGLHFFAGRVRRLRDLAHAQQRRQWAESLRELAWGISQLDDDDAIAEALVQRLPELIEHQHAAFFTVLGSSAQCVSQRGYAEPELEQLRLWAVQHRAALAELCRRGHAVRLPATDLPVAGLPAAADYLLLPLNTSSGRIQVLLAAHDETPFRGLQVELAGVLARQARVVLDNVALIQQLARLARYDNLTGACNRGWFREQADFALRRCARHHWPVSVLLLDIDHFKRINDRHGHAAGDAALAGLVRRCRKLLRTSDILGRYGGEEFVIFLPEASADAAVSTGERLRTEIGVRAMSTPAGPVPVTVSIGVASMMACDDSDLDALIARADRAMYDAKHAGRDRVHGAVGV